jgi:hypothetical protein
VDKPIDDALALFVGPRSSIQPNGELVEDQEAVARFIYRIAPFADRLEILDDWFIRETEYGTILAAIGEDVFKS